MHLSGLEDDTLLMYPERNLTVDQAHQTEKSIQEKEMTQSCQARREIQTQCDYSEGLEEDSAIQEAFEL